MLGMNNYLAGPAGFEPTSDGVKVRWLTTWLWAYKIFILYYNIIINNSKYDGATEGNRTPESRCHKPMR